MQTGQLTTDQLAPRPERLRRALNTPLLTLYGLGVTVGAGIYVLVGATAAQAGPFAPVSFLLAAVVVAFTAFSYAELSTRHPVSAGEAAYVEAGFGAGWLATLVGLAVALLPAPEVLILDEPTSGLDPLQRIEVRALLKELADQHTVLISSHILPEIEIPWAMPTLRPPLPKGPPPPNVERGKGDGREQQASPAAAGAVPGEIATPRG